MSLDSSEDLASTSTDATRNSTPPRPKSPWAKRAFLIGLPVVLGCVGLFLWLVTDDRPPLTAFGQQRV